MDGSIPRFPTSQKLGYALVNAMQAYCELHGTKPGSYWDPEFFTLVFIKVFGEEPDSDLDSRWNHLLHQQGMGALKAAEVFFKYD